MPTSGRPTYTRVGRPSVSEGRGVQETSRATSVVRPTRSSRFLFKTVSSLPYRSVAPFNAGTCGLHHPYLSSYLSEMTLDKHINRFVVCGVFHY